MTQLRRNKTILVTGAHRTGTTWVGKILAAAPGMTYISEPFNPQFFISEAVPINYWYEFISLDDSPERQASMTKYVRQALTFNFEDLFLEYRKHKNSMDFLARIKMHCLKLIYSGRIVKDPIALFSAEWLAQQFDMQVLVLIRHPAAFAGSLKAKNWKFNFRQLLQQKSLMETHLAEFASEMEQFDRLVKEKDIIDYAILLWKIFYQRIHTYQLAHPDWIFIRHEDLSLNPILEYERIFKKLGLGFSASVRKKIAVSTSGFDEKKLHRNSRENITKWKTRLSSDEIERVKTGTGDFWPLFYTESDW